MKIERYEIQLEVLADKDPLWKSPARGSLMHGLLVRETQANELHAGKSALRPYSQSLQPLGYKEYLWVINLLDSDKTKILKEWFLDFPETLYLQHHQVELSVKSISRTFSSSYADFLLSAIQEPVPRFMTLQLVTPTIFKKAGMSQAWNWPEPRLIAQSALSRWNSFSDAAKFDDPKILDEISANVFPRTFDLCGQHIAMDGVNMTGTIGSVSFNLGKQTELRQVFNLCTSYCQFSGLGAKTAMGLGAVRYLPNEIGSKNRRRSEREPLQECQTEFTAVQEPSLS